MRAPARRYIVLLQAPGGYPPRDAPPEPAPDPPHAQLHTAVLEPAYQELEAEVERLEAEVARLSAELEAARHA